MVLDTLAELVGLSDKDSNQIQIKRVLNDAELRQGAKYLNDKKTIAQNVKNNSILMEPFEPKEELWNKGSGSGDSLQSLAKSQMDELNKLEEQFQHYNKILLIKNNIQDEIKFLNQMKKHRETKFIM